MNLEGTATDVIQQVAAKDKNLAMMLIGALNTMKEAKVDSVTMPFTEDYSRAGQFEHVTMVLTPAGLTLTRQRKPISLH